MARYLLKNVFVGLSLICSVVVLSSCGLTPTSSKKTKTSSSSSPQKRQPQVERAHMPQKGSDLDSPAAPLVKKALQYFNENSYDSAEWKLEEAIHVDPDHGPAYYWLAVVKQKLRDTEVALRFLKRAEVLLGHSEEWSEKIATLKSTLIAVSTAP